MRTALNIYLFVFEILYIFLTCIFRCEFAKNLSARFVIQPHHRTICQLGEPDLSTGPVTPVKAPRSCGVISFKWPSTSHHSMVAGCGTATDRVPQEPESEDEASMNDEEDEREPGGMREALMWLSFVLC